MALNTKVLILAKKYEMASRNWKPGPELIRNRREIFLPRPFCYFDATGNKPN
jgi:hypothetical protein